MWVVLAFISALCLGGYDISKKIALRNHRVVDVLTASVWISSLLLCVPLIISRVFPGLLTGTLFFVPRLDSTGHLLTFVKSCIVLSSWIFAYISLKHLPLSVVSRFLLLVRGRQQGLCGRSSEHLSSSEKDSTHGNGSVFCSPSALSAPSRSKINRPSKTTICRRPTAIMPPWSWPLL